MNVDPTHFVPEGEYGCNRGNKGTKHKWQAKDHKEGKYALSGRKIPGLKRRCQSLRNFLK